MATVKSRFDSHPSLSASSLHDPVVAATNTDDNPWIATYSKGLCSLYPREDDDCFDVLLASQQQSNVYARQLQQQQHSDRGSASFSEKQPTRLRPELLRHRTEPVCSTASMDQHHHHHHHRHRTGVEGEPPQHTAAAQPMETQIFSVAYSNSSTRRRSFTLESFLSESSTSSPLSPARLSQAIAGWGFNCIDYFTRTGDEDLADEIEDRPSHTRLYDETAIEGTRVLDDCRPVFAAVCGKRSAALTRKRALSRSQSHASIADDPWLEAIDRLSRWDEVAYR